MTDPKKTPEAAAKADQKKFARWMTYIAGAAIAVYAGVSAWFYSVQDAAVFVPGSDKLGAPPAALQKGGPAIKTVSLETADGLKLSAWFAPPVRAGGRVVVIFPPNADPPPQEEDEAAAPKHKRNVYVEPATARSERIAAFRKHGDGVFLCEYRGFGGNPGMPSEAGFYADGRAALEFLDKHGYKPGRLVYDGVSIGAGVAVQMALEQPPAGLVLEAPFTSLTDQVKIRWSALPIDLLLRARFDNIGKIGKVTVPLLVVHGANDLVIPIRFARRLYAAGQDPKEMAELDGANHQDLYSFGADKKISSWLDKLGK
jgi:hypothetical protein